MEYQKIRKLKKETSEIPSRNEQVLLTLSYHM